MLAYRFQLHARTMDSAHIYIPMPSSLLLIYLIQKLKAPCTVLPSTCCAFVFCVYDLPCAYYAHHSPYEHIVHACVQLSIWISVS